MGLQSALSTALTGLQAAEATIDVTGNNVANSNTVGFKESSVLFATQFLRTLSIGSAPSDQRGGTNPRQFGLGVKVAAINPNFTQGTIEISSNPLDVAIQGDGFLIVQTPAGEFYSRAGQMSLNAANEIVTPSGNRVLGYGVDDDFNIIDTVRTTLTIPLGAAAVAKETENVFFTGSLSPEAEVGDIPEIITSAVLGNGEFEQPMGTFSLSDIATTPPPGTFSITPNGVGALTGDYEYRIVHATQAIGTETNADIIRSQEGPASIEVTYTGAAGEAIDLVTIPTKPAGDVYAFTRIYRSDPSDVSGENQFRLVGEIDSTVGTFTDDGSVAWAAAAKLEDDTLDLGNYSYYVTFLDTSGATTESRPSALIGARAVSEANERIILTNLPIPDSGTWDKMRIYRNLANDSGTFYRTGEIDINQKEFIDSKTDDAIEIEANKINLDGPPAGQGTLLSNLTIRDGNNFTKPFENSGALSFTGKRGGRSLDGKELQVVAGTTTVNDLVLFMEQALGIQKTSDLGSEPFPDPVKDAGLFVNTNGQIEITSNAGIENAISIGLTALQYRETGAATTSTIGLDFGSTQSAVGKGSTADFIVYDSLGIPLKVSVSTVLESKNGDQSTYRWFAFSEDNEPSSDGSDVSTAIGNGIIRFDINGNVLPGDIPTIAIDRNITSSQSPLEIALDCSEVSGLAIQNGSSEPVSSLNVNRQDGFPPGVLTSFIVTESGLIRGVFSNGTDRPLGQLLLARFANNTGLASVGDNLYAEGVNSGEPVRGLPGLGGLGTLLGGAVELSNTDIGQNLIELILASTQYRGNARVITTTQELLDELLALSR